MLPSVNTEDGSELTNNGILVCVGSDLDGTGLGVLDQPSPAGALDAGQSGVELLLHRVEAAVVGFDGLGESTRWGLTTTLRLGSEVLPEERVVDVTACVGGVNWFRTGIGSR